jgi:hypothetical protein
MHNTTPSCLHASRLVRQLTEMDISASPIMPERFAERVGALLDLSASVTLSKALGELARPSFEASGETPAAIKDAFVGERAALVRDIVKRFVAHTGPSRNRLPTLAELHAHCMSTDVFAMSGQAALPNCAAAFAPYRKHYLAIQGKLGLASHRLRMRTARAVAGLSPDLAGVAALDNALGDALYFRQRQFLDRIPTLLEQYFNTLLQTHWQTLSGNPEPDDLAPWMLPGGWLASFCGRMRELLLAELEIRLQPVLGLIESACQAGGDE